MSTCEETWSAPSANRDVVFGHEFCCEVVEHGPDTAKRLKPDFGVYTLAWTWSGHKPLRFEQGLVIGF